MTFHIENNDNYSIITELCRYVRKQTVDSGYKLCVSTTFKTLKIFNKNFVFALYMA